MQEEPIESMEAAEAETEPYKRKVIFLSIWVTIGLLCGLAVLIVVFRLHERLKPMRLVYVQMLLFHLFFLSTSIMRLCFWLQDDQEAILGYPPNVKYTVFSVSYLLQKVTYVLIYWTFAYQYWVVSLTLKQALDTSGKVVVAS